MSLMDSSQRRREGPEFGSWAFLLCLRERAGLERGGKEDGIEYGFIWRSTSTHLRGGNGKKILHFDYGGGISYAEIVKYLCGHAGVFNNCRDTVKRGDGRPVYCLFGGYRLADAEDAKLNATMEDL
ncbi:hypothetical protein C8Q69DRAFT_447346 [Paecilomyces variotii]|uniref:Uncharacterized protein n=1 Tax=Byssochlamys spectabilis TaxID=264951 RepID=A0A443HLH3_BYSSP|nr:hypothetical protein C8Q69DRAFT_447346 [Paecilomyces variotii]RWQ92664.1 hypothetical protein C8Q69DRAFT_447346 [Paecilomyces variotii]